MSLVGPRPLYMSQDREWNERQRKRLLVKPGLTGLAQISGRGELTIEEKLELDVKYVEQAGFWAGLPGSCSPRSCGSSREAGSTKSGTPRPKPRAARRPLTRKKTIAVGDL